MAPDRPRLPAVLARLTGASTGLCAQAAGVPDPLRYILARQVMAGQTVWQGAEDLRTAWESVAPEAWLSDGRARFFTGALTPPARDPPTLGAALALASDPAGVTSAEALALEFLARLRRVSTEPLPASPTVVWRVVTPRTFRATIVSDGTISWFAGAPEGRVDGLEAEAFLRAASPRVGGCASDAAAIFGWETLAPTRGAHPIHPVAALWDLGYALDTWTPTSIVLAAPMV